MSAKPDRDTSALSGHRARLRARLEQDPISVADYEVLELVLGLAITRKDTKILARELLFRFKSMKGVLDARHDELLLVPGFGPALLALWRLLREVLARYAASPLMWREVLASPEAVAGIGRPRLGNLPHEESWLALVDSQNRLISWERLLKGSISSIAIQPRDVFTPALVRKASGIILVHNHPGGNPLPSAADLKLTAELQKIAPHLDLRFLDHVIVTAGDCYSIGQSKILQTGGQ